MSRCAYCGGTGTLAAPDGSRLPCAICRPARAVPGALYVATCGTAPICDGTLVEVLDQLARLKPAGDVCIWRGSFAAVAVLGADGRNTWFSNRYTVAVPEPPHCCSKPARCLAAFSTSRGRLLEGRMSKQLQRDCPAS
jgi:hypothetical protein